MKSVHFCNTIEEESDTSHSDNEAYESLKAEKRKPDNNSGGDILGSAIGAAGITTAGINQIGIGGVGFEWAGVDKDCDIGQGPVTNSDVQAQTMEDTLDDHDNIAKSGGDKDMIRDSDIGLSLKGIETIGFEHFVPDRTGQVCSGGGTRCVDDLSYNATLPRQHRIHAGVDSHDREPIQGTGFHRVSSKDSGIETSFSDLDHNGRSHDLDHNGRSHDLDHTTERSHDIRDEKEHTRGSNDNFITMF